MDQSPGYRIWIDQQVFACYLISSGRLLAVLLYPGVGSLKVIQGNPPSDWRPKEISATLRSEAEAVEQIITG